ncbi:hypothetical protein D3C74_389740 [compost metagenome]
MGRQESFHVKYKVDECYIYMIIRFCRRIQLSDVLVILQYSGYTFLKDDMSLGGKNTFETELTFT